MKRIRIKPLKFKTPIPPFRIRSEKETEEMLHRYKVLARKNQIELVKLDSEYSDRAFSIYSHNDPISLSHLLKVGWESIKNGLQQLKP